MMELAIALCHDEDGQEVSSDYFGSTAMIQSRYYSRCFIVEG